MALKLVEAVLRRAIRQGGSVGYNPDMYDYGFADNIPPSEEFNNELKKYGKLKYSYGDCLYGCETWDSFVIDERGRAYIQEINRIKDGPFRIKKILRFLMMSIFVGFVLPVVIVLGVEVGLAWLICNIDTSDSYSWISGILHGLFIVPNYLRHSIDNNVLWYAQNHTTAYSIFFWISATFILYHQIVDLIKVIIRIIKEWFM